MAHDTGLPLSRSNFPPTMRMKSTSCHPESRDCGSKSRDQGSGFRDHGSGSRDQGSGFRDLSLESRDQGSECWDWGSKSWDRGLGFGVHGPGIGVQDPENVVWDPQNGKQGSGIATKWSMVSGCNPLIMETFELTLAHWGWIRCWLLPLVCSFTGASSERGGWN